jgi:hypothetical protein
MATSADLTSTPEHGKPSHGRSLPFLRLRSRPRVRLALHGGGRENSPSRPYDSGMTVVDRPTISGQYLGRFRAHSLLNKLKNASIYSHFARAQARPSIGLHTEKKCRPRSMAVGGLRGGSPRSIDRHARPRSCGENTSRLQMLVRTWSREFVRIIQVKSNQNVALHFSAATPRPQQNQWVMSRTKARTVEDGFDSPTNPALDVVYPSPISSGVASPIFCNCSRSVMARR